MNLQVVTIPRALFATYNNFRNLVHQFKLKHASNIIEPMLAHAVFHQQIARPITKVNIPSSRGLFFRAFHLSL